MSWSRAFDAIGTHWVIDITDIDEDKAEQLFVKVRARIELFEQTYSRFRSNSLISEMARKAGNYTLPADAQPLLDTYKTLYTATGGAFTPLIGKVLVDAGYDAKYSLKPKELSKPPTWEEALEYHFPILTVKQPVQLDFGACGKGYIVDLVSTMIKQEITSSFCVDAGGDMYYSNPAGTALRVGLEHPEDTTKVIGVANILNQSICGSAGNRRRWANFHHTINPHTLESPKNIIAIWVVADTALIADALTTCLFFTPAQKLLETYRFEYVMMYSDHSVEHSPNFPAELYS